MLDFVPPRLPPPSNPKMGTSRSQPLESQPAQPKVVWPPPGSVARMPNVGEGADLNPYREHMYRRIITIELAKAVCEHFRPIGEQEPMDEDSVLNEILDRPGNYMVLDMSKVNRPDLHTGIDNKLWEKASRWPGGEPLTDEEENRARMQVAFLKSKEVSDLHSSTMKAFQNFYSKLKTNGSKKPKPLW